MSLLSTRFWLAQYVACYVRRFRTVNLFLFCPSYTQTVQRGLMFSLILQKIGSFCPLRRIKSSKHFVIGVIVFALLYIALFSFRSYAGCGDLACFDTSSQFPYASRLPIIKHTTQSHQIYTVAKAMTLHKIHEHNQFDGGIRPGYVLLVSTGVASGEIVQLLDYLFLSYKIVTANRSYVPSLLALLQLSSRESSNFHIRLVIFEDFALYLRLPTKLRSSIDQYCITNDVGIIAFLNEGRAFSTEPDSLAKVSPSYS